MVHRSAHAATAVSLVRLPALPCGAFGPGGALGAPLGEGPALLEPMGFPEELEKFLALARHTARLPERA